MKEVQWLAQNRIALAAMLLALGAMIWAVVSVQQEDEPLWPVALSLALMVLIFFVQLRVSIHDGALRIRMAPLIWKRVQLADVERVEMLHYKPLRNFGGWGIRFGGGPFKGTVAYSMSGKEAFHVHLRDGKKFLVGTRRLRDWQLALQSAGVNVVAHPEAPTQ